MRPSIVKGEDLDVAFYYSWDGTGDPTPQECTIEALDSTGQVVFRAGGSFYAGGQGVHASSISFDIPEGKVRPHELGCPARP